MAAHTAPRPRRTELLFDSALALAVFAASLGLLAADADLKGGPDDLTAVRVLLVALASLPLVARRSAPLAVFVVTALASTALHAIAQPAGPPLGPTLALYWFAASADESRARTRFAFLLIASLLAAHVAANSVETGDFPATELLFGVLVWGGAWLAGDRTRMRHERMAELEERTERAEREAERERRLVAAEERTRLARDLHDSAGHAINVILVHAGAGRLQAERDPAAARRAFETIEEVARETVGDIDQLVRVLREDEPDGRVDQPPGLAAIDALVERQRAAGLDVTTGLRGRRRPLPARVDRGAYRILQEALTNAARHGGGSVRVEVAYGQDALELGVVNPLRDNPRPRGGGGHGIAGMRERAALLGGSVQAGARDGRFEVRARLPFAPERS